MSLRYLTACKYFGSADLQKAVPFIYCSTFDDSLSFAAHLRTPTPRFPRSDLINSSIRRGMSCLSRILTILSVPAVSIDRCLQGPEQKYCGKHEKPPCALKRVWVLLV
jgi:hypothetical protein